MTVQIQAEEMGVFKRHPDCPLCPEKASKIWISHDHQWMPIGILCKKCGAVVIYGLPESALTNKDDKNEDKS